jgi:putative DNA primase/helicase
MCATMFGVAPRYQRAVLLYGPGGTGKSVLDILGAMMPENAVCALPPTPWGERFALTPMVGKVLNVCGELPEDAMISGERFKGIVCGEPQDDRVQGQGRVHVQAMARTGSPRTTCRGRATRRTGSSAAGSSSSSPGRCRSPSAS